MYVSLTMTAHMSRNTKTGGVRLKTMLQRGMIDRAWLWIDTYNQCVNEVAGTIKARIDSNCMYFVSVDDEDIRIIKDKG